MQSSVMVSGHLCVVTIFLKPGGGSLLVYGTARQKSFNVVRFLNFFRSFLYAAIFLAIDSNELSLLKAGEIDHMRDSSSRNLTQ